ncbi:MAG: diguanylate cyclase [Thermoguttaceae bacterium]
MWFFLSLICLSFIAVTNVIAGLVAATVLGYGPKNWEKLRPNLISRLQNCSKFFKQYKISFNLLRNSFFILQGFAIRLINTIQQFRSKKGLEDESEENNDSESNKAATVSDDESFDEVMSSLARTDIGDLIADDTDEISNLVPMQEIFDEELLSVLATQGTEVWLVNEKRVETSLLNLNVVMMKSGKFAANLDWRIRCSEGNLSIAQVREFLQELKDDCCNYLESQAAITKQMLLRLDEFGELKYLAEEIDYANMEQSAQIETTLSNIDQLFSLDDPERGAKRILKELSSLRYARHRLRDLQERTFMKIVIYENLLETVPHQLFIDENSGIRGRIGVESILIEWWKQKRNQKRNITFALIDFVRFGEINEEYGILVCDKIIKNFGMQLEDKFTNTDLVGIYAGNCFLVATLNAGPQKTLSDIERIRQDAAKTYYRYEQVDRLQVNVTCVVTEALPTQTWQDVLAVLEKTMTFAKKTGRNNTYQDIPGSLKAAPEKVVAPDMGEMERVIDL